MRISWRRSSSSSGSTGEEARRLIIEPEIPSANLDLGFRFSWRSCAIGSLGGANVGGCLVELEMHTLRER